MGVPKNSTKTEERPVVLIVDGDETARQATARSIESAGLATREYASAGALLKEADPAWLGCVIAEMHLADMSAIDLLRRLRERPVDLPVIVLTSRAGVPAAVRTMQAGAADFLEKPCPAERLLKHVRQAVGLHQQRRGREARRAELRGRLASLTPEERRVLDRLIDGKQNRKIADELHMGLRTVELRRSSVMKKMKAKSLAELVRLAVTAMAETELP